MVELTFTAFGFSHNVNWILSSSGANKKYPFGVLVFPSLRECIRSFLKTGRQTGVQRE